MNIPKAIETKDQCIYALGGKIEDGELSLFCEVTNEFENVNQGKCVGNCSMQKRSESDEKI